MPYPHNRYPGSPAFEQLQLKYAVDYFLSRVEKYRAVKSALPDEDKKSLLSYFGIFMKSGWPLSAVEEIIYSRSYDTKSLDRACEAFRSLGTVALTIDNRDAVHVALYYIGVILEKACVKYNPSQPRVPRGHSDGGEWTDGGGGKPSRGNMLPRRKPKAPGIGKPHPHADSPYYHPGLDIYDPPINHVGNALTDALIFAPAARVATSLLKTTATEALTVISLLRSRALGRTGLIERNLKIKRAADSIEEFLGGRPHPKDVIINPKGDIVIIKGNKKFRIDEKRPGYKIQNGEKVPDEPHFHLQELKDGEWKDAVDQHRYYFKREDTLK